MTQEEVQALSISALDDLLDVCRKNGLGFPKEAGVTALEFIGHIYSKGRSGKSTPLVEKLYQTLALPRGEVLRRISIKYVPKQGMAEWSRSYLDKFLVFIEAGVIAWRLEQGV